MRFSQYLLVLSLSSCFAIGCGGSSDTIADDQGDTGDQGDSTDDGSTDASTDETSTDGSTDETSGGDTATGDSGGDTASGDTASGDTATGDTAAGDTGSSDTAIGDTADGGKVCGAIAGGFCPSGDYCKRADGTCGLTGGTGICTAEPTSCSTTSDPVCACNGVTYDNACLAAKAGQNINHTGACASTGSTCGGIAGLKCTSSSQFCSYSLSAMCGAGDKTGTCTDKPTICPGVVSPVCGCDGKTYNNTCEANKAGTSVAHTGHC